MVTAAPHTPALIRSHAAHRRSSDHAAFAGLVDGSFIAPREHTGAR